VLARMRYEKRATAHAESNDNSSECMLVISLYHDVYSPVVHQ